MEMDVSSRHHFLECAALRQLALQLSSDKSLKELIDDASPDMYHVHFTALKSVLAKYGASSAEYKLAVDTMEHELASFTQTIRSLYDGRVTAQFVILAGRQHQHHFNRHHLKAIVKHFKQLYGERMQTTIKSLRHTFPHVYIKGSVQPQHCQSINKQLSSSSEQSSSNDDKLNVQTECIPVVSAPARVLHNFVGETNNTNGTSNSDNYTAEDIIQYQIMFWIIVAIAIANCCACCAFFGWDEDSILYRSAQTKQKRN
eukprot:TRINITY_DN731_c0_g3_i3.p2 TRINITY_DN731_c0_g3~~TRINITY_DN731_c0_g3_i3.p2  ORF type:complete len:257 (-),score=89.93 TRINITY_DN731_c0_g3_i3:72-842(-)